MRSGAAGEPASSSDRRSAERHAQRMAQLSIDEYRACLRERVQEEAERLRREIACNGHRADVAVEAVTRLEHFVVRIAPPPPIEPARPSTPEEQGESMVRG